MDKKTTDKRSAQFYGEDFWNRARNISRSKARKLIGHYGFTEHDVPDIEQELLLALVKKLPYYDPEIAREATFIMRVAESRIADLIKYRQAGCRDWKQRVTSLNTPAGQTEFGVSDLVETIASENNGNSSLALDVDEFIEQLPVELAEICKLLKYYTTTEIMEIYPMSKTVFYHKLKAIKKIFHQKFHWEKGERHANNQLT